MDAHKQYDEASYWGGGVDKVTHAYILLTQQASYLSCLD